MRRGFLAPSHEDTCAGVERHGVCDGALAAAAEEGRLALLLWLLETRRFGRRQLDEALLAAARHRAGDHRFVDLLLSRGASAAARDASGDGAAHLCAASRDPAATRTLRSLLHHPSLARDALAVPNAEGRAPAAVAARLEAFEAVEVAAAWLERWGAARGRALSFGAPHAAWALGAVLERTAAAPLPWLLLALGLALLAAPAGTAGAAVASPKSLLGSGVASAFCVACALATRAALEDLDADVLTRAHAAVYAAYALLYVRCLAPVPRRRSAPGLAAAARSAPRLVDELCFSCRAPFRDGAHCLRCGTCVARRDHHCALLDRCVHAGNVNAFRLLLFLTLLAGASCLRVGVWSFAGVADERDAWPPDPRVWTRGLLGPRGCTCLLLLVLVPLGLVAVAYECARHALRAAGVERRFLDDGAGKKDD